MPFFVDSGPIPIIFGIWGFGIFGSRDSGPWIFGFWGWDSGFYEPFEQGCSLRGVKILKNDTPLDFTSLYQPGCPLRGVKILKIIFP